MNRLKDALDRRRDPISLFFRDDDAGWELPRLEALLNVFAGHECPIDLAVIPAALTKETADKLENWRIRHPAIGFHQHGYAHLNHEPEGARKCEFGAARPLERQCADIMIGRKRLTAMLGTVDHIFTSPWNRCLPETIERLSALGFAAYSDDGKVGAIANGVSYLPINLDWDRSRKLGQEVAALQTLFESASKRAGVMLHHASMASRAMEDLSQVLGQIRCHPNLRFVRMRDLLEMPS